jgi:hypothetical protein
MRRSHVEQRSRKYAARQYVSDTHHGRKSPRQVFVQSRADYERECERLEREYAPFDGKSFRGLKAAWMAKHGRR